MATKCKGAEVSFHASRRCRLAEGHDLTLPIPNALVHASDSIQRGIGPSEQWQPACSKKAV